jgi:CBS domain-containing protein
MTAPATCVPPGATVCEALEQMNRAGVGRVLVVDDGQLVGILTRSDVLRDYAREDDELHREVERAVRAAVGDCPLRLDHEVRDGVVLLRGWVELRSRAWAMAAAALAVPGVVDVDDDVLSDVDDTVVHELAVRGPWV